jgi:hypothetical protein
MKEKYIVYVDDNFHYMDTDERYEFGKFDTLDEAIKECKAIVDRSLTHLVGQINEAPNAEKLYSMYVAFGEDPWVSHSSGPLTPKFYAWGYAKEQCEKLCKE